MNPDATAVDRLRQASDEELRRLEEQEADCMKATLKELRGEAHKRELTTVEVKEQRQLFRALNRRMNPNRR